MAVEKEIRYTAYVIGIEEYTKDISSLKTPIKDADRFRKLLENEFNYTVEFCKDPDKAQLIEFLAKLAQPPEDKENIQEHIIFYFAGHGLAEEDENDDFDFHILPSDAKRDDRGTFVNMLALDEAFKSRSPHHLLVILDCCFAGAFMLSPPTRGSKVRERITREKYYHYQEHKCRQVLASASYDQKALDFFPGESSRGSELNQEHSPFALALIEGLEGEADAFPRPHGDGVITSLELQAYISERIFSLAQENSSLKQVPRLINLEKKLKGQFIFKNPRKRNWDPKLDLVSAPELIEKNNPYRGLKGYETEHKKFFFGRKAVVEKLVEKIEQSQFTILVGASGTGKSSLIKAGLIPSLGILEDADWEILPVMRPGEDLIKNLKFLFKNTEEDLGSRSLTECLSDYLRKHPTREILVVIDQFEEVITHTNSLERKEFILNEFNTFIENLPPSIHMLLSLRSDFEPQFTKVLEKNWTNNRFVIPPMNRDELREAILEPASRQSIFFEDQEMIEEMIDEVKDSPGSLPLLSFALSELYIKCKTNNNRTITRQDYQDLHGGVLGALRNRADKIFDNLGEDDKQTMKGIMLRMISFEGVEWAKRRMPERELVFDDEKETQRAKKVVEMLIDDRLLVSSDGFIEPAHEELIRGWGRLREWVDELGLGKLLLLRNISRASVEWEQMQGGLWHDNPNLPEGLKLANYSDWLMKYSDWLARRRRKL